MTGTGGYDFIGFCKKVCPAARNRVRFRESLGHRRCGSGFISVNRV